MHFARRRLPPDECSIAAQCNVVTCNTPFGLRTTRMPFFLRFFLGARRSRLCSGTNSRVNSYIRIVDMGDWGISGGDSRSGESSTQRSGRASRRHERGGTTKLAPGAPARRRRQRRRERRATATAPREEATDRRPTAMRRGRALPTTPQHAESASCRREGAAAERHTAASAAARPRETRSANAAPQAAAPRERRDGDRTQRGRDRADGHRHRPRPRARQHALAF